MRRLSAKSKKGKGGNANATNDNGKGSVLDAEAQDNENQAPSDAEESSSEKKASLNQSKKGKRGKKNAAVKGEDADMEDESWDEENSNKRSKRARKSTVARTEDDDEEGSDDMPLNNKSKKGKRGQNNDIEIKEDDIKEEEQYEVEKVVDCRIQSGVKQFKIRWKGFDEDQDTWESEGNLNCPDRIEAFMAENPDAVKKLTKVPKPKGGKKTKKGASSTQPREKKQRVVEPVSEEGGEKVYEVEKVVEVHFKKNGEREFLIRWKGFGSEDDTWEPESNLNCPELIEKFMEKVEKAKEVTMRELRANPQVTNRFTLNTPDKWRRLSSRHTARQRTTYFNAE